MVRQLLDVCSAHVCAADVQAFRHKHMFFSWARDWRDAFTLDWRGSDMHASALRANHSQQDLYQWGS